MEEILETSASELKVAAALMRAQEKFDPILKDTANPFYKSKYATLDQVIAATRPHLRAEGLIILQTNVQEGDRAGIATRLLHVESGEELRSQLLAKPKEDTIQQIAGVLTYCRRYEYHTITGTASEDDDGNEASGRSETVQTRSQSVREGIKNPLLPPMGGPAGYPAAKTNLPTNAPSTTTTAFAASSSVLTVPPAPAAPPTTQPVATTPVESTLPPNPDAIPDSREYAEYATRAMTLLEVLVKNGLKDGKGTGSAKIKFKKYLSNAAGVKDTKEISHGRWDVIFAEFEKLLATPEGTVSAVSLVETKEGK